LNQIIIEFVPNPPFPPLEKVEPNFTFRKGYKRNEEPNFTFRKGYKRNEEPNFTFRKGYKRNEEPNIEKVE
jgi:hypothetical protein